MPQSQPSQVKDIKEILAQIAPGDRDFVLKAYEFAKDCLDQKKRPSGEPYLSHILNTAYTLVTWRLSPTVVVAGLLHSALGSGTATEVDIESKFGKDVLSIIKGARYLISLRYMGLTKHAEDLRHFFVALSRDLRIIFIAFAHRLDTMNNIEARTPSDQVRLSREALEIYAPLANRMGMGRLKARFEYLAFPYVYPAEHKKTVTLMRKNEREANKRLEKIYRSLRKFLIKEKIDIIDVDYRLKNTYSLYKKLLRNDFKIDKITDLLALRIVTKNTEDCYKILGLIHSHWKPVTGRVKDYIATPKPNGYQSVHTTIYTGDGAMAEIQIKTKEMHEEAEFGVAAHVAYDEEGKPKRGAKWSADLVWVKELLEIARKSKDNREFIEAVELDYFKNRIFVFTPKGDVIELPEGATPLDFAYVIHSDIGNRTKGVRVNGKFVSFDTTLREGDTIEIETSPKAHPTDKWLSMAHTTGARDKIRNYLAKSKAKS